MLRQILVIIALRVLVSEQFLMDNSVIGNDLGNTVYGRGRRHKLAFSYVLKGRDIRIRTKKFKVLVRQEDILDGLLLHEHVGNVTFSRKLHTYKKEWAAYVPIQRRNGVVIIELNPRSGALHVEGHLDISGSNFVIGKSSGSAKMHALGRKFRQARLQRIIPFWRGAMNNLVPGIRAKRATPVHTVNQLVVVDKYLVEVLNQSSANPRKYYGFGVIDDYFRTKLSCVQASNNTCQKLLILKGLAEDNSFSVTEFLHKFYAVIIVSINQYMKTLAPNGLHIQCRGGGLLILRDDIAKPGELYHHTSKKYRNRQTTEAAETLKVFKNYLKKKNVAYDFATLLTGHALVRNGDKAIAGRSLAMGSVCSDDAVAIVETRGDKNDVIVAAHELGHGLGAEHDGRDPNIRCNKRYVMSPSVEVSELIDPEAHRTYSSCSSKNILANIAKKLPGRCNCGVITSTIEMTGFSK